MSSSPQYLKDRYWLRRTGANRWSTTLASNRDQCPARKASVSKGANLPRGNPTKQRVLELLAEFFCLRTNDAAELLRNHAITESDKRSVRRTLSILHRDGFLYRAPHFDFGHERGGVAYV
jgi:hypothetical protein